MKLIYVVFSIAVLIATAVLIWQLWRKLRKYRKDEAMSDEDVQYISIRVKALLILIAGYCGIALVKNTIELIGLIQS